MKKLFLLGGLLVLGVLAITLFIPVHRHETLNGYIQKLRGKGEKMTLEELIGSLSPQTNDTVAVLTNLIPQLDPLPSGASNLQIRLFIEPGRARLASKMADPTWLIPLASPPADWSIVSNCVASRMPPLQALQKALKSPSANAGPRTDYFRAVTPFRTVRSAAQWLAFQAIWYLHSRQPANALAAIEALAALADLHREEYSLVSQMTRAGVADMGFALTWEALNAAEWNADQLSALQESWSKADFLEAIERAMEGERCMGRESIKKFREQDPSRTNKFEKSYYASKLLDNDLLFQLRHVQGYVEEIRALRANRSWTEVSSNLDSLNARMDALTNSVQKVTYLFTLVGTPNFKRAVWKCALTETERRLVITAIALKRYQKLNGELPEALDRLVPNFMPSVPFDCMDGRPLHYHPRDKDSCLLYSAGEDGRDDGGDPSPSKSGEKPGLWTGRDAVWPSPEK